ncbi:MAG: helix-turn-helix domain-containing protein [Parahaliea sp.]
MATSEAITTVSALILSPSDNTPENVASSSDVAQAVSSATVSPGAMLRDAREKAGKSEVELADALKWMRNYVAIIEQDNYSALRSPGLARGYVRSYGRYLGLDEERLLAAFDERACAAGIDYTNIRKCPLPEAVGRVPTLAIVFCLFVFSLLLAALWYWHDTPADEFAAPEQPPAQIHSQVDVQVNDEK